jgi:hypothetical protein
MEYRRRRALLYRQWTIFIFQSLWSNDFQAMSIYNNSGNMLYQDSMHINLYKTDIGIAMLGFCLVCSSHSSQLIHPLHLCFLSCGLLMIEHSCLLYCWHVELIQGYFLLLHLIDFEVVVYEGIIREKPSSKEEAREFIKGLLNGLHSHLFSLIS